MRRIAIAAVGLAVLLISRRRSKRRRSTPQTMPDEGSAGGYRYFTRRTEGAAPTTVAPVVVLLHGFAGDPEKAVDAVLPLLGAPAHVVVPRGKNKGPKWWLLRAATADQDALADQMAWAVDDFRPFLDRVAKRYGRKPVVVGHSQGGMFAAALALLAPGSVSRAVGASAWVPQRLHRADGAPLVVVHGEQDEVVPFARTSAWVDAAREAGADLELRQVDHGHGLSGELLAEWGRSIRAAL